MEIDEYIINQLKAISANVYMEFNPFTANYPCIIISNDGSEPVECMGEPTDFENFRYQISIWSTSRSQTVSLARLTRELLDDTSNYGSIGVDKVIYKGQSADYVDLTRAPGAKVNETARAYGVDMDFEFWTHL